MSEKINLNNRISRNKDLDASNKLFQKRLDERIKKRKEEFGDLRSYRSREKTEPKTDFKILKSGDIRISVTSTSGPSSKQMGMANKSDINKLFSDGEITEKQKDKALEAIKNRPKPRMKQIAPDSDIKIKPRMKYMDKGGDTKKPKKKEGLAIMIAVGKVKKGKEKMAYGGMAGGKKHMYVAGGSVTDNPGLKALKASGPKGLEAYNKIKGNTK